MISGILLAAGESSRMAPNFKPLMKWGRRSVIGECIKQLRESNLEDIFVVLGHREFEIRSTLYGNGVQYIINADYKRGMLSSLQAGLGALSGNSDGVLIALVDQPMITSEMVNQLLAAFSQEGKGIAVPTYEGRHGHPVVLASKYFDDVQQIALDAPDGLRGFIADHANDVLEVPFDDPAVIEDIDVPGDYERLSKLVEPLYKVHKWQP